MPITTMYCGWLSFQHTAARRRLAKCFNVFSLVSGFNTQPPEGGWPISMQCKLLHHRFQHTAARRRLDPRILVLGLLRFVSTHSRPKAAGYLVARFRTGRYSFNTQPPEGGWAGRKAKHSVCFRFQHTAARRRLGFNVKFRFIAPFCFNTQPPEGGWFDKIRIGTNQNGFNTQPPEGGWVQMD